MKHARKLTSLLLALVMVFAVATTAFAADETGSITIDNAVVGQTYTIYEILKLESYNKDSGAYSYKATSEWNGFINSADIKGTYVNVDSQGYVTWVKDADAAAFAKLAQAYAKNNSIANQGSTKATDATVTFTGLELGLYLLVQHKAAKGYETAAPFLVSVPMEEDGVLRYDVDASPKVELEKEPEPTSTTPPAPTDPRLPYTGQLNWPVPVLTVLGLGLLALGLALRRKSRHG